MMVNSKRNSFFKRPSEFIQNIYNENGLNDIENKVLESFNSYVVLPTDIDSIPVLEDGDYGTLVRWNGMVQDTGYGTEMYLSTSSTNQCLVYGANQDTEVAFNDDDDLMKVRERTNVYAVQVPGQSSTISQNVNEELPRGPNHKFPLTDCYNRLGVLLKIYDNDLASSLRPATNYTFIGILSKLPLPKSLENLDGPDESANNQETIVPCLHVLHSQPLIYNPTNNNKDTHIFNEILDWLTNDILAGDKLTAYWVLLSLISHIHSRRSGVPLGSLPLTISYPHTSDSQKSYKPKLITAIESLTSLCVNLNLTIESLNARRFYPHSNGDDLQAGALQLSPCTTIIFDERQLGTGTLNDTGVRNVHAIQNVVQNQQLEYNFPFSSFPFETDLNCIFITDSSKSIIPGSIQINLNCNNPDDLFGDITLNDNDNEKINVWRQFILESKFKQIIIPDEMSNVIQQSFVDERQEFKANGGVGEGISQEDLGRRITLSRLLNAFKDDKELTKSDWEIATQLDKDRECRFT